MSDPNPAPQGMYRTINFRDGDRKWGYPLPHLLGMRFKERNALEQSDKIALRFSTTDVLIVGTNLRCLWRSLLASEEEHASICAPYKSKAGDFEEVFTVTNIHQCKLTPKWEKSVEERKNDSYHNK